MGVPVQERRRESYQPVDGMPVGYQPDEVQLEQSATMGSSSAVAQLFARLTQDIDEQRPPNCIHFVVDFLCRHYPEHLHGFASIWNADPELERERQDVVNFFKSNKISTQVAAHFTNAGYDTLETLTTLNPDSLADIEAFNNVKWLPGHKVRLQQIFTDISAKVRSHQQQAKPASSYPTARPAAAHLMAPNAPMIMPAGLGAPVAVQQMPVMPQSYVPGPQQQPQLPPGVNLGFNMETGGQTYLGARYAATN